MANKKKPTTKKIAKREQSPKTSETLTVEQAYEIAVKHFKNDNLEQAELFCREILKVAPNYSSALDMLGVVLAKAGKLDEAEELIKKAIEIAPHEQNYHRNLSVVHHLRKKTQLASVAINESPKVKTQSWEKLVHCFLPFSAIPQLNNENPFDIIIPIYNGLNFLTKLIPQLLENTKIT